MSGSGTTYKAAVIGVGKKDRPCDAGGYKMGYSHGKAYVDSGRCEIVACADIVQENADVFAATFNVPNTYLDYREMIEKEALDIVSICVWPHLHGQMTVDCAEAGVKAVHCEKPMALTWGESRKMAAICEAKGTRLTFNHQRRFGKPFRQARDLVQAGEIGELVRLESGAGCIYDTGTHVIDGMGMLNGEAEAEWVIGQVDVSQGAKIFGVPAETHGLYAWKYANGVHGIYGVGEPGKAFGLWMRAVGTEGVIELGQFGKQTLRIRRCSAPDWEVIDTQGENLHGPGYFVRAIHDVVRALDDGSESELCARNALKTTEIIFASYESSRRRGLVRLPLEIEDNPLVAMLESGTFRL
ncbi:MAG: Gfo/Idh/MocA family oxidoreductase [Kiritimatiellae bacterium]|nr:Gfo/Idh/MocA family oxidoreductase [Kiritimatiellia bacterium]